MPRVLAFDTTLAACSAAILDDGSVRAARHEPMARGHAERLVPMLEEVREEAGLAYRDLDLIAVTVGPGTFTGVRIGLAAARGLALVADLPILGLGTLEAIAAGAGAGLDEATLAVLDARRGEVYAQAFGPGLAEALTPPQLLPLEMLSGIVPDRVGVIVGTGAALAADRLAESRTGGWRIAPGPVLPDAAILARRALLKAGEARRDAPPKPLYLRAADAKLPGSNG